MPVMYKKHYLDLPIIYNIKPQLSLFPNNHLVLMSEKKLEQYNLKK